MPLDGLGALSRPNGLAIRSGDVCVHGVVRRAGYRVQARSYMSRSVSVACTAGAIGIAASAFPTSPVAVWHSELGIPGILPCPAALRTSSCLTAPDGFSPASAAGLRARSTLNSTPLDRHPGTCFPPQGPSVRRSDGATPTPGGPTGPPDASPATPLRALRAACLASYLRQRVTRDGRRPFRVASADRK